LRKSKKGEMSVIEAIEREKPPSGSGFGDLPLTELPQVRSSFNLKGLNGLRF